MGSAEKLEKTYRAIMSRQVSVSSRWTVLSASSACITAFSSAEPRLQVVLDVCILHRTGSGVTHRYRRGHEVKECTGSSEVRDLS